MTQRPFTRWVFGENSTAGRLIIHGNYVLSQTRGVRLAQKGMMLP